MSKYKYFVHGLKVASELELDAYSYEFDEPDVEISLNDDVVLDKKVLFEDHVYSIGKDVVLEKVNKIGTFYSKDGKYINIKKETALEAQMVNFFIEGRGFAPILNQRGILTLHGSVVRYKGIGIAILGDSGAGKSSLTMGFINDGASFVSDDLIGVYNEDGNAVIYQGLNCQKLGNRLINRYDVESLIKCQVKYPGMMLEKYLIDQSSILKLEPTELKAIVILSKHKSPMETLYAKGADKVRLIFENFYRKDYIDYFIPFEKQYEIIHQLVNNCKIISLKRELGVESVNKQLKVLKEMLNEY